VEAFRESEQKEIQAIRELRTRNLEKQQLEESSAGQQQQQKYCVCRKTPSGFMLQCELCKDWFHGTQAVHHRRARAFSTWLWSQICRDCESRQ